MAEKVKFKYGTSAQYASATKDENTLYFVYEDSASQGRLYKGNVEITSEVADIVISTETNGKKTMTISYVNDKGVVVTMLSDNAASKLAEFYNANNTLIATGTLNGFVKLSDSTNSTSAASEGIAATPKAVKDALDAAKAYADDVVSGGLAGLTGAMVLMGTVSNQSDLAALKNVKKGYTYIVSGVPVGDTASIGGHNVENGDKLIAAKDSPSATTAGDWYVTQANVEGAVTATNVLGDGYVVIGDGKRGVKTLDSKGKGGKVLKVNSSTETPEWADDTDTTYTLSSSNATVTLTPSSGSAQSIEVNNVKNAGTASKLGTSTKGSATKPIYLNAGTPTECSPYAGGTKVTLNGTAKGASDASFYAPTGAGTKGQYLESNGSGAPVWVTKDTVVTENSTNLVTSGAVYSGVVGAIEDAFDEYLVWQPIATA